MQQQTHLVRAYSLISSFNIFVQSESTTTLYTAQGINQPHIASDLMGSALIEGSFYTFHSLCQNCQGEIVTTAG